MHFSSLSQNRHFLLYSKSQTFSSQDIGNCSLRISDNKECILC